jgi:hypothetical protein
MIKYTFKFGSTIYQNIAEAYYNDDGYFTSNNTWLKYLASFPGVKFVECGSSSTETVITFDSVEDKTFFILRWS